MPEGRQQPKWETALWRTSAVHASGTDWDFNIQFEPGRTDHPEAAHTVPGSSSHGLASYHACQYRP